ncbi:hypothetical protein R3P38DRAFT_2792748 [Favolaschia claudopus]|uniref:F-box domain-containing protein n=1 Tax=Favolaschia claudopus TaxID=2862362 RepID=A0AAW0AF48_9AGAR
MSIAPPLALISPRLQWCRHGNATISTLSSYVFKLDQSHPDLVHLNLVEPRIVGAFTTKEALTRRPEAQSRTTPHGAVLSTHPRRADPLGPRLHRRCRPAHRRPAPVGRHALQSVENASNIGKAAAIRDPCDGWEGRDFDGGRKVSIMIDPTGTGNNFVEAEITKNRDPSVKSTAGFGACTVASHLASSSSSTGTGAAKSGKVPCKRSKKNRRAAATRAARFLRELEREVEEQERKQQTRIQSASASKTQIEDFISEAEFRISSLTEKIEALQLEAQFVPLSDLRDTERAISAALRHLIAPARSLPVELLRLIFSLAFRHIDAPHGRDFHISWQRKYHIQDVYRLSHVCSDWQAAAVGTPELWVASPLVVSPSNQSIDSYAEGLGSWFARSAHLPLSLCLQRSAEAPQMANEIMAVASRCRSLRFPRTVSASFLLQLGNLSRGSLEELEICDEVEQDIDFESISCFTEMPRLRKLTLDSGLPIPMPWAQLTDISFIRRDRKDGLFTILKECKQLVSAHISVRIHDTGFSIVLFTIVLHHLRVLKLSSDVEDRAFDVMTTFLDPILAPSLDELCFENPGKLADGSLTDFQLGSRDITKLSLAGPHIEISSHTLKNSLRHAPLLTHISIEQCPVFTLEMLTRALASLDSDSQFLVPRLSVLTLTDIMWHGPGVIDAVHSLIRARWWTHDEIAAGLKRTTVEPWSRVHIRDVSAYTGERNIYKDTTATESAGKFWIG